jgi:hypothetical protein
MTHGSQLTGRKSAPWSKADIETYLLIGAIGILCGVAVTCARTPLHLPGHKALFWMTPLLIVRLISKARFAVTAGTIAVVLTTAALGGRIAGGVMMMPLVIVAGAVLDLAAAAVERHNAGFLVGLCIIGSAAAGANLICFIKRSFEPLGSYFSSGNLTDMASVAAWHAMFGLTAGLLAWMVARAWPVRK